LGDLATQRLIEMSERRKLIGHVRGPGFFVSCELEKDRNSKEPAIKAAAERGGPTISTSKQPV
jgi:4-aminobutyrate aminotransferase/(S)-3-amino-2-methylpropionate transaminase